MSCDRAKMSWQCGRLQWCWAHLKRDFQALVEHPDKQVQRLGRDLLRPTQELFRQWARCRDGTITREDMQRILTPVREAVNALLLRGAFSGNARLVGMCRELYEHREWLWTFLEVEGVEPTNNAAERSLRCVVTTALGLLPPSSVGGLSCFWRKLSFGTQSSEGSRFVETLLSVIETCRQQERSVLDHVTSAVTAHFHGQTGPSLLTRA